MNNNNLYSMNQFGGIPVEVFPNAKGKEREEDYIFICQLVNGYTNEEKGERIDSSKTLYIDGLKQKAEVTDEGRKFKQLLSVIVEKRLSDLRKFPLENNCPPYPFIFGETIVGDISKDSQLISRFIFEDYLRLKSYNRKGSSKQDILKEHDFALFELIDNLLAMYFPQFPQIEATKLKESKLIEDKKTFEKAIEEKKAEIEELSEELNKINESLKIDYDCLETVKEEIERLKERAITEEKPNIEVNSKKAEIKAILQEHINRREEQENALQGEESLIPEEIQRKAVFYIEHGFIEEVKGAGHYKILRGLNTVQFAYIVQRVRAKTGYTLSIDDMTAYIYNKQGKPCSKSSFNKPNSKGIEDSILKELQELLSE